MTTPLTETSSETGSTVTPALARTSSAYLPAGTSGAASTTLRSLRARSASPVMCSGLPGATAMMSLLAANADDLPVRSPAFVHAARVGRGEHVRRGSLLHLGHQVVAAGEVEVDLHVRVGGGEVAAQLGEGVGQRRRGEHAELARLIGGRVRRVRRPRPRGPARAARPPRADVRTRKSQRPAPDRGAAERASLTVVCGRGRRVRLAGRLGSDGPTHGSGWSCPWLLSKHGEVRAFPPGPTTATTHRRPTVCPWYGPAPVADAVGRRAWRWTCRGYHRRRQVAPASTRHLRSSHANPFHIRRRPLW